jgi:hypothetical protein
MKATLTLREPLPVAKISNDHRAEIHIQPEPSHITLHKGIQPKWLIAMDLDPPVNFEILDKFNLVLPI